MARRQPFRRSLPRRDQFRVRGGALTGTASGTVAIDRASLLELHDVLSNDGDGDARAVLSEFGQTRDWLRDVLLGR